MNRLQIILCVVLTGACGIDSQHGGNGSESKGVQASTKTSLPEVSVFVSQMQPDVHSEETLQRLKFNLRIGVSDQFIFPADLTFKELYTGLLANKKNQSDFSEKQELLEQIRDALARVAENIHAWGSSKTDGNVRPPIQRSDAMLRISSMREPFVQVVRRVDNAPVTGEAAIAHLKELGEISLSIAQEAAHHAYPAERDVFAVPQQ